VYNVFEFTDNDILYFYIYDNYLPEEYATLSPRGGLVSFRCRASLDCVVLEASSFSNFEGGGGGGGEAGIENFALGPSEASLVAASALLLPLAVRCCWVELLAMGKDVSGRAAANIDRVAAVGELLLSTAVAPHDGTDSTTTSRSSIVVSSSEPAPLFSKALHSSAAAVSVCETDADSATFSLRCDFSTGNGSPEAVARLTVSLYRCSTARTSSISVQIWPTYSINARSKYCTVHYLNYRLRTGTVQ
jgi:hypothetical protein